MSAPFSALASKHRGGDRLTLTLALITQTLQRCSWCRARGQGLLSNCGTEAALRVQLGYGRVCAFRPGALPSLDCDTNCHFSLVCPVFKRGLIGWRVLTLAGSCAPICAAMKWRQRWSSLTRRSARRYLVRTMRTGTDGRRCMGCDARILRPC